jgi:Uma2 family endonuclease
MLLRQDGLSASRRWTSADLFNFPEDGKRREIIAGELYESLRPHFYHQILCGHFASELNVWDEDKSVRAVTAPGLIFSETDDIAPDVVWVSKERLAAILRDGKLCAAPELVIEVLALGSENIARDREAKLWLYSRRKVDEYWIADWREQRIEVYRTNRDHLLHVSTLGSGDTLTSPILPGFALLIDRLFVGIPCDAEGGE